MRYELRELDSSGKPIAEAPNVIFHSKIAVQDYITERFSKEGLDWQCQGFFKTREMTRPQGFFKTDGVTPINFN